MSVGKAIGMDNCEGGAVNVVRFCGCSMLIVLCSIDLHFSVASHAFNPLDRTFLPYPSPGIAWACHHR